MVAAAIASTAWLIQTNATLTCGTLSIRSASTKVTARPMAACRQFTAPRFSLMMKAMAMIAITPAADCRFSMTCRTPFPELIVAAALSSVMHRPKLQPG